MKTTTRCLPAAALAAALLCAPTGARAQTLGDVVSGIGGLAGLLGGGTAQRVQMIANQLIQIRNQGSMLGTLDDQFDELEDQLAHMRDEALGRVGQLSSSLQQLATAPADLLDQRVAWANTFTGDARTLSDAVLGMGANSNSLITHWQAELANADVVGESDILGLLPHDSTFANRWRERRETSDRLRAADFTVFDAAGRVAELLGDAQTSLNTLRTETNLSNTALQQLQVANELTAGELNVALAQLEAYRSIQEGVERQERELAERRALEQWAADIRAFQQQDARLDAAIANYDPNPFLRLGVGRPQPPNGGSN